MMLKEAINSVMFPRMTDICKALFLMAQPELPPTLSLEEERALLFVVYNLHEQAKCVRKILILGQFRSGGENYNGDRYSEIDWRRIDKEIVTSLGLEFDSNVDSENHINKLILEIIKFNQILIDFNKELQSNISSGYFKLEGDPIKFERNKINLLSPPNMFKTSLEIKRPHSKRDLAGILAYMPQDLAGIFEDLPPRDLVEVLGYSLVGYEAMLKVLEKLQ